MRTRVLLTGATGAIGLALLPELLDLGFIVYCLVRSRPGQSAEHRLRAVTRHPNAIAIDGDITKPLGGIDLTQLPPIDKFVHAAADTSLHHACGAKVLAANQAGTVRLLALAEALGWPEFHYIGTAYIAGDAPVLGEQALGETLCVGRPRNPYEASKFEAECAVRGYRGSISILRPSIVVGRSDDGSAPLLEGWYGFFKSAWRLRETLRRGNYFDEHGLRLFGTRDYQLKLPVTIKNAESTTLNLIQIDWLARTTAHLIALPARGRTYNVTHPKSVTVGALLRATLVALDLSSAVLVSEEDKPGWTLSPVKLAVGRLINRELDRYRPYLQHAPQFVSANLYADLGPGWPAPPQITAAYIDLTMKAIEQDWLEDFDGDNTGGSGVVALPPGIRPGEAVSDGERGLVGGERGNGTESSDSGVFERLSRTLLT